MTREFCEANKNNSVYKKIDGTEYWTDKEPTIIENFVLEFTRPCAITKIRRLRKKLFSGKKVLGLTLRVSTPKNLLF